MDGHNYSYMYVGGGITLQCFNQSAREMFTYVKVDSIRTVFIKVVRCTNL